MGDVNEEYLKRALLSCFGDNEFRKTLREIFKEDFEARDKEIKELKQQVCEQQKLIETQAEAIDDLEQYSRRNCLNVNGVAETVNEKPLRMAIDLAKTLGVQLQSSDIDRAHRVGKAQPPAQDGSSRARPLIIKFVSYTKRDEVWRARKQLRTALPPRQSCLTADSITRAYITENLTRRNQKVMYVARQLRRENKIWAAWSDDCVMKVKTREGGPTQKIRTEADLHRIVGAAEGARRPATVTPTPTPAGRGPDSAGAAGAVASYAAAAAAGAQP